MAPPTPKEHPHDQATKKRGSRVPLRPGEDQHHIQPAKGAEVGRQTAGDCMNAEQTTGWGVQFLLSVIQGLLQPDSASRQKTQRTTSYADRRGRGDRPSLTERGEKGTVQGPLGCSLSRRKPMRSLSFGPAVRSSFRQIRVAFYAHFQLRHWKVETLSFFPENMERTALLSLVERNQEVRERFAGGC